MKNKILLISPHPPSDLGGGEFLLKNRLKELSNYLEIYLISRSSKKIEPKELNFLKETFIYEKVTNLFKIIYIYFIKTIFMIYFLVIKNGIKNIQLEYTESLIYPIFLIPLRLFGKIRVFYTAHDISYLNIRRGSFSSYLMRGFEIINIKYFIDKVFVWGTDDYNELVKQGVVKNKIKIIPPIILENKQSWDASKSLDFVFLGSLKHKPNLDSLNYIINNWWPKIKRLSPYSKLYLIVAQKNKLPFANNQDIINLGYVKNIDPIISRCKAMLAPIVSGTGIKVKIIEGFSKGIPIITNSKGLRNFRDIKFDKLLVADDLEGQLILIERVLKNKINLNHISLYERNYYFENFSSKISKEYLNQYE